MVLRRRFIATKSLPLSVKQVYNFKNGVNTSTANEQLPDTASPYARNYRYKSRETVQTRKGPGYYSQPVGETLDASQTSIAGFANKNISTTTKLAAKWTATGTGLLTKVELALKTATPAGTGPVIVEIYSDSAGSPGTLLATSSILSGSITSTYVYLPARFLAPASIVNGTPYWTVAYVQDDGTNGYNWSSTTAATTAKTNINAAGWTATTYDLDHKTYLSTAGQVIGGARFYQSTGTKYSVFATSAGVYSVNDVTGVATLIFAGSSSATRYVFEQVNDTLYWTNGFDAPQQWNGVVVTPVPGSPPISTYVKLHKNTLFFVSAADPTRVVFSQPGDYTSYTSVSFLYVPSPLNPDPIQAVISLQDNLIFRTRQTRWVLYGSDLASFTLRRSTGLQGVVSPGATVTHDNYEYFVSDNGIYTFNGATDTLISEPIQPDFDAITDKTKINIVISGNYLRVFYPTPGSAYNNMCIVFDLIFGQVFIDDSSYFNVGFVMKGGGDAETLVLGSSLVGALYYADYAYSDLGAPIAFEYRTKYETYGQPAAKKFIKRFYPEFTAQAGDYTCTIEVDFDLADSPQPVSEVNLQGEGPVWGAFVWGAFTWGSEGMIQERLSVPGHFKSRQYRFSNTGVEQPVEILGYSDYFLTKRPR